MSTKRAKLYIGTSGYQYDQWKGPFYPPSLPKKEWLTYYAAHFDTVEINNTFYQLPSAKTFDAWKGQAPSGFCYALKFSRYGSHIKRLKDPQRPIQQFLERANRLGPFLGPILVQLPPHWKADIDRLSGFLETVPPGPRWAIEFRDPRWLCEDVYRLLARYNVALCIHDMIPQHPRSLTADWAYVRFHGDHYGGSYTPQALSAQARWIKQCLAEGKDVFAYFNNDAHGYAVQNATDLKRYVKKR